MKRLFSNSCIYNYNVSSLAKKIGRGRTFVRNHISLFLAKGWCRLHHGNLIFNRHKHLPQKDKKHLQLIEQEVKGHTIDNYLSAFKAFLVKDANRKQQYARAKSSRSDEAYWVASCEKDGWWPYTVKSASKTFKVSPATCSRWLRNLANERWFKRHTPKPHLSSVSIIFNNETSRVELRNVVSTTPSGDDAFFTKRSKLVPFKGHMLVCYPSHILYGDHQPSLSSSM